MFLLGYPTISFHCPSIGEKFIIFSWEKNQFLKQWYNSGSFPIGLQMSLQLPDCEGLCGRQGEVKPRSGRR